jgi:hypothetical protein
VKLLQLPRGVRMLDPAAEITAKDMQVVFHIEAEADALTGLNKGIACEVTFTEAGQTVHSTTGNGTLRVDLPRGSV